MTLSRRDVLRLAGGAAIAIPFASACSGSGSTGALLVSRAELPQPFRVPLPVPPVLAPARSDATTDYYEITQQPGEAEVLPGLATEIWGYNGIFPGPTIESRSGRRTVVRQRNELPTPVSTHLHGGHTPPEHDGYPTDLILPAGASGRPEHAGAPGWSFQRGVKEYVYPLEQRATTLWYHDHRMDFTGPQVWRGLAGFHILHDDEDDALPLPKGDKDIPLMIADRAFTADGALRYPALDASLEGEHGVKQKYMEGVLGDVILVNGAPWPELEVSNTRYRFRILNASNARRYKLTLDPPPREGASFIQVGSDGGLLDRPAGHEELPIAQAERYDVVIDFSSYPIDTTITLRNEIGGESTTQVMQFRVTRRQSDDSAVPDKLADLTDYHDLDPAQAQVTREFRFTQGAGGDGQVIWTVNGKPFSPTRMNARPQLGATEVWKFVTDVHHPVHLHLVQFKILSRQSDDPRPTDVGWKDTIDLPPGHVAKIAVRFTGYRGRYVFHCHNLEHEDMAMMANFEVI